MKWNRHTRGSQRGLPGPQREAATSESLSGPRPPAIGLGTRLFTDDTGLRNFTGVVVSTSQVTHKVK